MQRIGNEKLYKVGLKVLQLYQVLSAGWASGRKNLVTLKMPVKSSNSKNERVYRYFSISDLTELKKMRSLSNVNGQSPVFQVHGVV